MEGNISFLGSGGVVTQAKLDAQIKGLLGEPTCPDCARCPKYAQALRIAVGLSFNEKPLFFERFEIICCLPNDSNLISYPQRKLTA